MDQNIDQQNENSLVKAAQAGNRTALGHLFDMYLPRVYRRICTLVPLTDAEDVTQEVFLSMVRSIHSFRGQSAFSTWLFNIIQRRVADYYRKNKRQIQEISIDQEESSKTPIVVEHTDLDDEIITKKVLSMLSESQREIIYLRLVEGYPFNEIAEKLSIELGAAKLRFYRAVSACQEIFIQIQNGDVTFEAVRPTKEVRY